MGIRQPPKSISIPKEIEGLAAIAVQAAFDVHKEHGPGLLESACEACFCRELELRGIAFQQQVIVPLQYKGRYVEAGFRGDVLMEGKLLVELKAIEGLQKIHRAQVITYLKLMKLSLGLLVNFNETLIKNGIRRVLNIPKG